MKFTEEQIFVFLTNIFNPDVQVLNIVEMGIVQAVEIENDKTRIEIIPTFDGDLSINPIKDEIITSLSLLGLENLSVQIDNTQEWSIDFMNKTAIEKLKYFGITTPIISDQHDQSAKCPHCNSIINQLEDNSDTLKSLSLHCCNNCKKSFKLLKTI